MFFHIPQQANSMQPQGRVSCRLLQRCSAATTKTASRGNACATNRCVYVDVYRDAYIRTCPSTCTSLYIHLHICIHTYIRIFGCTTPRPIIMQLAVQTPTNTTLLQRRSCPRCRHVKIECHRTTMGTSPRRRGRARATRKQFLEH